MRAAGERVGGLWPALAAGGISFCALFFGRGASNAPLVWIGGIALLLAAVAASLAPPRLDGPAALFLGCLFALAVWAGFTTLWSTSPDSTWKYMNRTLVYAAFALAGVVVGARVSRAVIAGAASVLLALLVGWALLAKCIPALYSDYGRLARLRSPVDYWNELALLCDAGVPIALWLSSRRRAGTVLLYGLSVTLLLTYSRVGVVLACLAAAAWVLADRDRLESLAALALGGGAGAAVFGIALALPGITNDGQPRGVRVHDGWIFALVVAAGTAFVFAGATLLRHRPVPPERRARLERAAELAALAAALAGLALSIVFAGRIWREFTNPVTSQLNEQPGRLHSARSPRWTWWKEAWHAFTRHPGGGTGAGTFELTNALLRRAPIVADEPHNTPLQFLSETGIVGYLLFLGTATGALWGAWRARVEPAGAALGIAVAAFFVHTVVDKDWNYVATCGPLLLVAGALLGHRRTQVTPRPLLAICAVAVALAAIYSLAAPWLAERELASASSVAAVKRAHSYDPLSVDALTEWAAFEDAAGNFLHAQSLYRDAVALEPQNAEAWYALGAFYFEHQAWDNAYIALNNSYTYDRFGPAAQPCGLLDQARKKAHNYTPPQLKCPAARRASNP